MPKNRDTSVLLFFGHVLKTPAVDKGVYYLLANTLSGREDDLLSDITFALNEKSLTGRYAQFYKITSYTDHKLEELWALHSPYEFAKRHKDFLKDLSEFLFGRTRWKFTDDGLIECAQPI